MRNVTNNGNNAFLFNVTKILSLREYLFFFKIEVATVENRLQLQPK